MNVAIIPARRGSKGILNKNLQKIGNRSLVDRTIDSALDSGIFQQIILTTDIPYLQDYYRASKQILIRTRPTSLAADDSEISATVIDAMNAFGVWPENRIWLLQPTACFRQKKDYQAILDLFKSEVVRSVISVFNVGANNPSRMYTIKNDRLYPINFTNFKNKQDLPDDYQRSGHFYVCGARDFREHRTFYLTPCRPYVVERLRGICNIDEPLDLKLAQLLFREGICR